MKWGRVLKRLPFRLPESKDINGDYNSIFFIDEIAIRVTSAESMEKLNINIKDLVKIAKLQHELAKEKLSPDVIDCFVHQGDFYSVMERMKHTLAKASELKTGLLDLKEINQQVDKIQEKEKELWHKFRIIRSDRHHNNTIVDFDDKIRFIDFVMDYQVPSFIDEDFILKLNNWESRSIDFTFYKLFQEKWSTKMNSTRDLLVNDINHGNFKQMYEYSKKIINRDIEKIINRDLKKIIDRDIEKINDRDSKEIIEHKSSATNKSTKTRFTAHDIELEKDVYFESDIFSWSVVENVFDVKRDAGKKLLRKDSGTKVGNFSHQSYFNMYYPGITPRGKKLKLTIRSMKFKDSIKMMKDYFLPLLQSLTKKKLFPTIKDIFHDNRFMYMITEFGGPNIVTVEDLPKPAKLKEVTDKIKQHCKKYGVYTPDYIPLILENGKIMLANDLSLIYFLGACAIWPRSISKRQRKVIEDNPLQRNIFYGIFRKRTQDRELMYHDYRDIVFERLKKFDSSKKETMHGLKIYIFDNDDMLSFN